MTQPVSYAPDTDFEAELGTAHGSHLNAEFENLATTLSQILTNISLIQRDDTKLANLTVHPDTLTSATKLLLGTKWTAKGLWGTSTNYYAGDVVEDGGKTYVATVDHVSGVFATDKTVGKWVVIYEPISTAGISASMISFSPSGTIAAVTVQNAIAEVASESLSRSLNLSDLPSTPTALANLGGMPKAGGAFYGAVLNNQSADIAASGTVDLSLATGNYVKVSGASTISSFGSVQAGSVFYIEFVGVCTLVHNAISLKIPGNANITTVSGDVAIVVSLGGGNWRVVNFIQSSYFINASYQYLTANFGINGSQFSHRNKIINGSLQISQRYESTPISVVAGAALAYCADRMFAYCTGANVAGARGQISTGLKKYSFTGAASVTGIGFGHRIESINAASLASKTVSFSALLSNSLLTSCTWSAYYANTVDTFGTLAAPTKTLIATGSFTMNSSLNRFTAQFSAPALAANGIEIILTVGAQTSGDWSIAQLQLEEGSSATPFEFLPKTIEMQLCQRYYERSLRDDGLSVPAQNNGSNTGEVEFPAVKAAAVVNFFNVRYDVHKRKSSNTITFYNPLAANAQVRDTTGSVDCTVTGSGNNTSAGFTISYTGNAATAVGNRMAVHWTSEAEL